MSGPRPDAAAPTARLVAAFAAIYLVWGSTFLAVKLGVQRLPPLLFAGGRFLFAGALLAAVAVLLRERFAATRREWLYLLLLSLLMISLSNGFVTVALGHIPSNEAALLAASNALWIAGLGALGPQGHRLGVRSLAGLLVGFAGVVLLVWPRGSAPSGHLGWQLVALAGSLCWSAGTVIYRNARLGVGPVAFNAVLMLGGGAWLTAAGFAAGEAPRWQWQAGGLLALAYLAVFGSAVAYTAYAYLLKHTTAERVGTFAYVNPAVAALLGWAVLGESLGPLQLAGMLVVLLGVLLVTLPGRLVRAAAAGFSART